jgi:hypothetical protein
LCYDLLRFSLCFEICAFLWNADPPPSCPTLHHLPTREVAGGKRDASACYAQNGRHDGAGPSEVRQQASPSCLIGGFGKLVFFSFCSIRSRLPLMAPKKPWSLVKNNNQPTVHQAHNTRIIRRQRNWLVLSILEYNPEALVMAPHKQQST